MDEFDSALTALCELHGKEMSVAFYELYKKAILSVLTVQEAIQAITLAFSHKTYGFPKPFDLIELIKPASQQESDALVAWETLEQTIRCIGHWDSILFTDPKISRVVVAMGGWIEICKWTTEEITRYRRNEFMKLYKAAGKDCDQQILPGVHEIENRTRGYFKAIPDPAVVGEGKVALALPRTQRQKFVEHCINTLLSEPLEPVDEQKDEE